MKGNRPAVQIGIWLGVALVAAALACNAGGATPQPTVPAATTLPTVQPTRQTTETDDPGQGSSQNGAPVASEGDSTLAIHNNLAEPICYVYLSPTTAGSWGGDWLGAGEIIEVGGMRSFSLDAGQWDVMVADCDNVELESTYNLAISGQAGWEPAASSGAPVSSGGAPAASGSTTLELVNNSNVTICWVFMSLSTADSWGGDWLETDVIEPGWTYTFTLPTGTWDLKADDCDNRTLDEQYAVVIDSPMTWTLSGMTGGSSSEPLCGDGFCGDFENAGNCPADCGGSSEPLCGDGFCGDFENGGNCPQDCADFDFCGDAVCAAWERNNVCVADCGYEGALCGNGVCGDFENPGNCPADCGYSPDCGDGLCDQWESYDTCPIDCQ